MGVSSSSELARSEQHEAEAKASATGALPFLQQAFSSLSHPDSKTVPCSSLQQCLSMEITGPTCQKSPIHEIQQLLNQLGPALLTAFFRSGDKSIDWVEFLNGYLCCCGMMSSSSSTVLLLKLFATMPEKSGICSALKVEDEADMICCKVGGFITSTELCSLLIVCWTMFGWTYLSNSFPKPDIPGFPDPNPLVLSAVMEYTEIGDDFDIWKFNPSSLELRLPAEKIQAWITKTIPFLGNCLSQFVHKRILYSAESRPECTLSFSEGDCSFVNTCGTLLTRGSSWSILLTLHAENNDLARMSFFKDGEVDENLLYSSRVHGKGLNRFWSEIEGYRGLVLFLIRGCSGNVFEPGGGSGEWIIGALVHQGFESRDSFYGITGSLYSISPVFRSFQPTGSGKNFVYSRFKHRGRRYDPHLGQVGIGFGGSIENERVFLEEDFEKVVIRHHTVDKTYSSGPLLPFQSFLPVEAMVCEVEAWGLGGKAAKEEQAVYNNRELLFAEQRRQVDLKAFGRWDESPEKTMMNMISDPNVIRREDR